MRPDVGRRRRRRARPVTACLLLGVLLAACSTGPTATPTAVAPPGCHTPAATVRVVLADRPPVPVARTVTGGCVAVTVPPSPFPHAPTAPLHTVPGGRLRLVSDSLSADGTRVAYYTAVRTGTATVTTTVAVHTGRPVPEWSALVVVV